MELDDAMLASKPNRPTLNLNLVNLSLAPSLFFSDGRQQKCFMTDHDTN